MYPKVIMSFCILSFTNNKYYIIATNVVLPTAKVFPKLYLIENTGLIERVVVLDCKNSYEKHLIQNTNLNLDKIPMINYRIYD